MTNKQEANLEYFAGSVFWILFIFSLYKAFTLGLFSNIFLILATLIGIFILSSVVSIYITKISIKIIDYEKPFYKR